MELPESRQPPPSRVSFDPHRPQHRPKVSNKVVRGEGVPHAFCSMDGNWLRHTSLAWGEQTSVHDSHSGMVSGSPNTRTTPFLVKEIVVDRVLSVASPTVRTWLPLQFDPIGGA